MAIQCLYNNQEECDPRECYNHHCPRSSWDKLRCDFCNEIIEDVYYNIKGNKFCKKCLDELFKEHID